MPIVEHLDTGAFSAPVEPLAPKPEAKFKDIFGAGFAQENDVYAAIDYLAQQQQWPKDPNFKIVNELQQYDLENRSSFWGNYRDNFLGVESKEEMLSLIARINEENARKELLSQGGITGLVAQIAGGMLSPTTLLPFIGAKRGFAAVRQGAAMGALGGALQELPLQAAQQTRTGMDAAFSIGGAAILGGMLGGAASALSRSEFEVLARRMDDELGMAASPGQRAISGLSSDVPADTPAGRLKHAYAMKVADWMSPVTRVINQQVNRAFSHGMSQLSDAGLQLEGNARGINTAVGGTVEANARTYYGMYGRYALEADDLYSKYIFGESNVPGFAPNIRASIAGMTSPTKMTRREFAEEVSRALRNGDEHSIPEVRTAARSARANVLDPILQRAQDAKLLGNTKLVGDLSYLYRMFSNDRINANPQAFIEKLAAHGARKMNAEFGERLAREAGSEAADRAEIEDIIRPRVEQENLAMTIAGRAKDLEDTRPAVIKAAEEDMAKLRAQIRQLEKANAPSATIAEAKNDLDLIRETFKVPLTALAKERAGLRRRASAIKRNLSTLSDRQHAKLQAVEAVEDRNVRTIDRVVRQGRKFLDNLDSLSDKELDKELRELRDEFADLAERFDKGEIKIQKLSTDLSDEKINLAYDKLDELKDKMTEATGELGWKEGWDRGAYRQAVTDALTELERRNLKTIERRVQRQGRLLEAAANLDPKIALERARTLGKRIEDRKAKTFEKYQYAGIKYADLDARSADFLPHATEIATHLKDRITGTYYRLPIVDILTDARGPELRRLLDISSNEIEEFLENDVEKVLKTYVRTMSGDIEMMKRFGSLNGEQVIVDAAKEMNEKLVALGEKAKAEKWSDSKLIKENQEVRTAYDKMKRDFEVVVGRIRSTWGLPSDPNAMGFRVGRTLLDVNVLRLMGGTLISSIPDAARVMMRHGFARAFADGYAPMVSDWQRLKLAKREARYAGVALDTIMHMRAQGMHDVLDEIGRYSKFEKGLNYLSNKMGMVNLLDQWTDVMKQVSASAAIARLTDSVDIVYGGAKASPRAVEEAKTFLASKGLLNTHGENILKELNTGKGGTRVNDVLMPNTEEWSSEATKQAFRQALAGEVNSSIITPGVERPVWMDASMTGRLISQFKSFALSSTQKILMAGLQNPTDAGVLVGSTMSIALGMLSYYIAATVAGGDTYSRMQNASLGKWMDEGIARSGVLGIFADGQRFAERFPLTQPYANLGGDRVSRRAGDDLAEVLLGPSFSGMVGLGKVFQGLDDPTQATVQEMRKLLPWQNHFALKRPLDTLIQSLDLPERR